MPKRQKDEYDSDDGFVADAPHTKKPKSKAAPAGQQTDENGDPFFPLNPSGMRRVTVNTFKGKTMVNLREYYEKDGKTLPGKKGISLPMDQYKALVAALPEVEGVLVGRGEDVPRPVYGAAASVKEEVMGDGDGDGADDGGDKRNFEATSSEGEE